MRGHAVLGVLSGLMFGLFLAVTLVLGGVLPLNSVLVTAMPILGLAYGLLMAKMAPFGKGAAGREERTDGVAPAG